MISFMLMVWAWLSAGSLTGRLPLSRRWQNMQNFLSELVPSPVRISGDWFDAFPWAWDLFVDKGFPALLTTVWVACAATILAAVIVLPFLPLASRKLGRRDPLGVWDGVEKNQQGSTRNLTLLLLEKRKFLGSIIRFLFVLARAVPEYILAFLFISLLGLQVWPLLLALAIHNFGSFGRLFGEVIENGDFRAAEQAIANGFGRKKAFGLVIFPAAFNRFLIYFFYRWEACLKDATALGMLGLLTLGHLIALSKGFFWDEMFFYVLLGSSVIIVGDLFSTWLRRSLRG